MVAKQKRSIASGACLFAVLLAVVGLVIAVSVNGHTKEVPPASVGGVLRLDNWSLKENGKVPLAGEWRFRWKKQDETSIVHVPGAWSGYNLNGLHAERQGYATYSLRIELSESVEVLALKIPVVPTSYIVTADGRTIAEGGQVSDREGDAVAAFRPQTVYFKPSSSTVNLIVQISNFTKRAGGMTQVLELGTGEHMGKLRERELGGAMFFLGSSLVLAFYFVYAWIVRRFLRAAFYFGVLCLLAGIRMLVTDQLFILQMVPGIGIEWLSFLEASSLLGGGLFSVLFLRQLYPDNVHPIVAKIMLKLGLFIGLPMVAASIDAVPYFRWAFLGYLVLWGGYVVYVLVHAAGQKREGAGVRLAVLLINAMAGIHDGLFHLGRDVLFDRPVLYYSAFLFIFLEAADFSKRFPEQRPHVRIREPSHAVQETEFNLLIVDADCFSHRLIRESLTDERYRIVSTMSGVDALLYTERAGRLDLVLVDSDVPGPGMSGLELVRQIRRRFSPEELPVVMMIQKDQDESAIKEGFQAGASDFLVKPLLAGELHARLHLYLELKKLTEAAATSELAMLQAEIKPHFLYNTLNTILSLTLEEPQKAHDLLLKLSSFLRSSYLLKDTSRLIGLSQEIELVRAYLFIEGARYGNRLRIEYDVDESLNPAIPPFIIQPIVENAVKHGIIPNREGGTVKLTARSGDQGSLRITIEDDGVGIPSDRIETLLREDNRGMRGMALLNIHQRLVRMYGTGLTLFSEAGKGTRVDIYIPEESVDR